MRLYGNERILWEKFWDCFGNEMKMKFLDLKKIKNWKKPMEKLPTNFDGKVLIRQEIPPDKAYMRLKRDLLMLASEHIYQKVSVVYKMLNIM